MYIPETRLGRKCAPNRGSHRALAVDRDPRAQALPGLPHAVQPVGGAAELREKQAPQRPQAHPVRGGAAPPRPRTAEARLVARANPAPARAGAESAQHKLRDDLPRRLERAFGRPKGKVHPQARPRLFSSPPQGKAVQKPWKREQTGEICDRAYDSRTSRRGEQS